MKKIISIFAIFISIFFTSKISAEEYTEYKIGDLVKYKDIAFYVIENSSSSREDVQLLKMIPLSHEEINNYTDNKAYLDVADETILEYSKSDENQFYGNMAFYYGDDCYKCIRGCSTIYTGYTGCINDYDLSNVKKVVDLWTLENFNDEDIVMLDDIYKSRLLNESDLGKFDNCSISNTYNCPKWLTSFNYYSWTMEKGIVSGNIAGGYIYEENTVIKTIPEASGPGNYVFKGGSVRPTIKLKKNSLTKISDNKEEYHNNEIREYKIGDIINYNDIKFYVIKNSSESDNTVTILKDSPLTEYELKKNGLGHLNNYVTNTERGEVIKWGNDDDKAKVAYFTSDTCHDLSIYIGNGSYEHDIVYSGCTTNYDESDVKYIVDNWLIDTINDDDIGIDSTGYSARLINEDDLIGLNYIKKEPNSSSDTVFKANNGEYKFILNNNSNKLLTMIKTNKYTYNYQTNEYNLENAIAIGNEYGYSFVACTVPNYAVGTVRPVVTLNKKEIAKKITNVEEIENSEDGNVIIDIKSDVDNINNLNVPVPNTLSKFNKIVITIGIILITISFIIFRYIKKK